MAVSENYKVVKKLTFLHHKQIAFVRTLPTHAWMLLWLLSNRQWNMISITISTQPPSDLPLLLRPTVFPGKFGQIPLATLQNYAAYRNKIIKIPQLTVAFRLRVNWALFCSAIMLNYSSNIQRKLSIFVRVQPVKLHRVCFIWFCRIATAIVRAHSFTQFSLIFFHHIPW